MNPDSICPDCKHVMVRKDLSVQEGFLVFGDERTDLYKIREKRSIPVWVCRTCLKYDVV